jgi:hypothetical protein
MDGPDLNTDSTQYLPDTPIISQLSAPNHVSGFSVHRIDYAEGAQVAAGGNGVTGADETSEDLNNTFTNNSLPSPNAGIIPPPSATFVANLNGGQEVPPVFTSGHGTGNFTLNFDSTELSYDISIQDVEGTIVAAHFHNAPTGQNGGVVKTIFSGTLDGSDTTFTGIWSSSDPEPLTPALVNELFAGNIYVNVHTDLYPPGEVRGQIYDFAIANDPPTAVNLLTPTDGSVITTSPTSTDSFLVSWTQASDPDGDEVHYWLQLDSSLAFDLFTEPTGSDTGGYVQLFELDFLLDSLGIAQGDSVLMYWRVFSGDSVGNFTASADTFTFTAFREVPVLNPPPNLTATAGTNTVDLMWDAPLPLGAVELSPSGESRPLSIAEIKQYKLTHKVNETTRLTGDVYLDGNDTPVTGAVGSAQMTLEKPVSGEEVGSPLPLEKLSNGYSIEGLTGYNIYRSEDGVNFTNIASVDSNTTQYTDAGLVAGDYWYYVTALYPEGESDPSNTVMATVGPEPLMGLLHTPGDLNAAIFNDGSIGTENLGFAGPGVTWKGQNGLFAGGPIFGTTAVGSVNGLLGSLGIVGDILNVTSNFTGGFTTAPNFDQVTEALLNDAGAPTPYVVDIIQRSYSNTGEEHVFIRYGFVNNSGATLDDFYSGIIIDWDIDASTFGSNQGGYALSERLVYQFDASGTPYYYGVAVLDALVGYKTTPDLPTPDFRTGSFTWISTPDLDPIASPGDFRSWQGTGPASIAPGDTLWRTFAIVAGDDLSGIRANAAAAAAKSASLGWTTVLGIGDDLAEVPLDFALDQNFPNPFNPTTTIKYALKENADVVLKIYNVLGQLVKTLVNEKQTAGFKTANWDGTNQYGVKVASGIYIYRIEANDFVEAKKLVLMK